MVTIFLFDLSIYLQHIVFHKVPFLWRIHRVHHSDINIDVTTGIRFHPLEIFISLFYKFFLIAIIGAPALAVIIFEILLNSSSMFNHSNIKINSKYEKFLRLFIVTPDMHHVHHSTCSIKSNKNFGFNLNIWDKIFGTYIKLSSDSVISIKKGVEIFRSKNDMRIDKLIYQPLIKDKINIKE
ncbi:sterol desaturase family protein [Alphaproteobacteria bacterium]|nr:sterol desaturase family protein [Alphaproteobacteria bacterium]